MTPPPAPTPKREHQRHHQREHQREHQRDRPHAAHAAHELGRRGEDRAARWYQENGYEILARNWRCFEGEIDVVAARGDIVAICEVKARASARFVDPALAVGRAKQSKVRKAAFRWLEQGPQQGNTTRRLRFDVALVVGGELEVIEGAF